jgi:uncharacterized protein YqjF (DUF2071 family)
VEWMDNPISLPFGRLLYGLPYRTGSFTFSSDDRVEKMQVEDPTTRDGFRVSVRKSDRLAEEIAEGSLDSFLVEKYTAYTHEDGVSRFFRIAHPRWTITRPRVAVDDDRLVRRCCPWFKHARMVSVHASAGFPEVSMGYPHRTSDAASLPTIGLVPKFY